MHIPIWSSEAHAARSVSGYGIEQNTAVEKEKPWRNCL